MDLQKYSFPLITDAELSFPTIGTDFKLLKEAESRGLSDWNHPYHRLFSNLFFKGGKVVFKDGIDGDFKNIAWRYCRALMRSYTPKHEDKAAVCALIMSELLEPNLAKP